MAGLKVLKGTNPGAVLFLNDEQTVFGRHPNCQIVLDNRAISRHHAQILESHGSYYIEDLRSRNGTFVNGEAVDGRRPLADGDQIRMCDVLLSFQLQPSLQPADADDSIATQTAGMLHAEELGSADESRIFLLPEGPPEPEFESPSAVVKRIDTRRDEAARIGVRPEVKLKAILELTRALRGELQIDSVLPKLLTTLLNLFPQAEQGFVLMRDAEGDRLKVKATISRAGQEAQGVAVSMTVVRLALETRQAILSRNISDDSRFRESSLPKMRIRSVMCAPMVDHDGHGLGVIQVVTREARREFDEDDLDLLASVASQSALAIENAALHEEQVQRHELERDLEFATQVQMGFLPKSRPRIPGYAFADYYEAALRVGGDYFDYLALPDGRLAVAIGDVAGKGMPAALLMARLYSATRFQLLTAKSPAAAVAGLNAEIFGSGVGHRFITFLLIVIDPQRHAMTLVNAGHLAPLVRNAAGHVSAVGRETSGLPLGIVPEQSYQEVTLPIHPGDTIIAYTDGISEALTPSRDIYGRERLQGSLARASGDIRQVIEAIIADVELFLGEEPFSDDTCVVGFQRDPE